jgi:hypothetical protein
VEVFGGVAVHHASIGLNLTQKLPIQRAPIAAFTIRADVRRPILLFCEFEWSEKFRLTFFALVEVHHFKRKNTSQLKNIIQDHLHA